MKIKVCGMKDPENIIQLIALEPDYIGFIFHSQSSRHIGKIEKKILENIPVEIKKVGVFVDEPIDLLVEKYLKNKLDMVQLHGYEIPEYCEELKKLHIPLIKAFRVGDSFNFKRTKAYESCCDAFLFDTAGKLAGGNGAKFEWNVLAHYEGNRPFFLSGGIGPEDLEEIIHFSHPTLFGVDVNSGFETEPGKKDIVKLDKFIRDLRNNFKLQTI